MRSRLTKRRRFTNIIAILFITLFAILLLRVASVTLSLRNTLPENRYAHVQGTKVR